MASRSEPSNVVSGTVSTDSIGGGVRGQKYQPAATAPMDTSATAPAIILRGVIAGADCGGATAADPLTVGRFLGVYDDQTGDLTYTNAGHLSPILVRNGEAIPLDSNGTVVGAFPHVPYDQSCLRLEGGDLLVCYTDGITEPENEYGEMFGEERLIEVILANSWREASEVASAIVESVQNWTSTSELQDDMTLVVARKL